MTTNTNDASNIASCKKRLEALAKYTTPNEVLPLNGKPYKVTDVQAVYEDSMRTRAVLSTKRVETEAALKARVLADATRKGVDAGLRAWVTTKFGLTGTEAAEFGFAPKAKTQPTAKTKAAAVDKVLATRKARGTKGKKQRKATQPPAPTPVAVPPMK